MRAEGADPEFAKAVATYLALAVDRIATFCNSLSTWINQRELIADIFTRQALPMVWDYVEANPLSGVSGSIDLALSYVQGVLTHLTQIPGSESRPSEVRQGGEP